MEFKNLVETLNTISDLSLQQYKENIKNGAYATGTLFNSVKYRLDINDKGIRLTFTDLPDYYIKVEKGQKPGENNLSREFIGKIYKWMLVKKIPTKNNAAFFISRSIVKKGVKPKPYLRNIKIEIKNNYTDDIISAFKKDIEINLKNKNN